jgi:hypothetical protein
MWFIPDIYNSTFLDKMWMFMNGIGSIMIANSIFKMTK